MMILITVCMIRADGYFKGDTQFRVPVLQGFSEKYCPKRSAGAEIFAKTRRA
jgi:uncharacterized membrane protein